MLGVIFVIAPIDQLHASGQMFGLVPGMPEYTPRAGGEQAGDEDEEYESGTDQAPKGAGAMRNTHRNPRWDVEVSTSCGILAAGR